MTHFHIHQSSENLETHQKRFLADPIPHLHKEFTKQHGPVSRGLFYSRKPTWIVSPKDKDRQVNAVVDFNTVGVGPNSNKRRRLR